MISDERWKAQSLKRLETDVRSLPKHPVLSEEGAGSVLGTGQCRPCAPGLRRCGTRWSCLSRPHSSSLVWRCLFFKASARQCLMEEHGVTRNKMMFIQSTRPAAAALVYREDLMLNLLIRTNYATITLKPCLRDDTLQVGIPLNTGEQVIDKMPQAKHVVVKCSLNAA